MQFKASAIRELKALMALKNIKDTKSALQVGDDELRTALAPPRSTHHTHAIALSQVLYQPGFHLDFGFDVNRVPDPPVATVVNERTRMEVDEGDENTVVVRQSPPALVKSHSVPNVMARFHIAPLVVPDSSPSPDADTNLKMGLLEARTDVDLTDHAHPHVWTNERAAAAAAAAATAATAAAAATAASQVESEGGRGAIHPLAHLVV